MFIVGDQLVSFELLYLVYTAAIYIIILILTKPSWRDRERASHARNLFVGLLRTVKAISLTWRVRKEQGTCNNVLAAWGYSNFVKSFASTGRSAERCIPFCWSYKAGGIRCQMNLFFTTNTSKHSIFHRYSSLTAHHGQLLPPHPHCCRHYRHIGYSISQCQERHSRLCPRPWQQTWNPPRLRAGLHHRWRCHFRP